MKNKVLNYLFVLTMLFVLSWSGNMLTQSMTAPTTETSTRTVKQLQ